MSRNIKILDRQFVPAGTLIIEQGTMGSRAFMIESGALEVFVKDAEGNEIVLSELGVGALVGEMAAISDGQRSASVRTKENSVLITIPASDLQSSMHASGGLYKRLMRMMTDRMKDSNLKLLKKEQQLADVENAFRQNIKSVESHLASKQDKLRKQMMPLVDNIKSAWEKFQSTDFQKD